MRLWTIHPKYLDAKGLVAAWREALLAQKVLAGKTRGYKHHPQLIRFQVQPKPLPVMAAFLRGLASEATRRGYNFDATKISKPEFKGQIPETRGQLDYEWQHLRRKLKSRTPALYREYRGISVPEAHPLFRIVPGNVQQWEKR
jgi:Pyrimidine dimer DNA glycosylase